MSASHERPAATRADEERRARALLLLLSPLVHRLNNSLAVVQGVHELGVQACESERELAARELGVLRQTLARVALLARASASRPERIELREVFRALELLLAPLAAERGVEFALRAAGADGVEVDARLEPLLLAAIAALLAAGPPRPARLCVGARPGRRGLVIALGTSGAAPGEELAALRTLARELGWRQGLRATRGACSLRLTLPGANRAAAPSAPEAGQPARRVLLLHAPDAERELVMALLRENGWTVLASAVEPRAGLFDLALVERRLALADPGLLARLRERFALGRVALVEPRMRPGALLALLGS